MLTVFFILNDHGGSDICSMYGLSMYLRPTELSRHVQSDIKSELITARRHSSYLHTAKR